MFEALLPFYERELSVLRGLAAEFAERYPKVARRLQIDHDHCDDPQVERLLEAFAWFGAGIHRRLDDEVPEVAEAFLQMTGPHFTRPIPSTLMLQVLPDPGKPLPQGRYTLPRHTPALSPPVRGVRCEFRTCHRVDLWPLKVTGAGLELPQACPALRQAGQDTGALALDLATLTGAGFAALKVDRLRFHLDGDPALAHLLHELLCFKLRGILVTRGPDDPGPGILLPATCVEPGGFSAEEALYGPDPGALHGYRLLFEYFAFPDKFRCFDLTGLDRAEAATPGPRVRLHFLLPWAELGEGAMRLLRSLSADPFKLGCVPAVNLFPDAGESLKLSGLPPGQPLPVRGRKSSECEVYTIDSVRMALPGSPAGASLLVPPHQAFPGAPACPDAGCSWQAIRQPAARDRLPGTEVDLVLVDPDGRPVPNPAPGATLELQLTCSDRNRAEAISVGAGEASREGFLLTGHPLLAIHPLGRPTPSLEPPARPGRQWRIIAHLSMNHRSLATLDQTALQYLLELYPCSGSAAVARQIHGIHHLESRPATARLPVSGQPHFVRGIELALTFDEACYEGASPFLFAAILERFFAQLCLGNSFVKMRVLGRRGGELASWAPRPGQTPLI